MKKLLLIALLITQSFSEDLRIEIIKRYDNGNKKLLVKYRGEGVDEVIVERITYSKSGDTLKFEKPLDKIHLEREYYENGQLFFQTNYKDEIRVGKWTNYHSNGQIRKEGNFKDDEMDGKWIWYYENGQIEEERNYIDGKREGKYTYYYENGKIRKEGNFKDDEMDGKWIWYNENGQIRFEGSYKDGKLVK